MTEQQGNEKTSTAAQSLTLRVKLGPQGVARFQEFLSGQHQRHADAQSLFPGYDFVVSHWPPADFSDEGQQPDKARPFGRQNVAADPD